VLATSVATVATFVFGSVVRALLSTPVVLMVTLVLMLLLLLLLLLLPTPIKAFVIKALVIKGVDVLAPTRPTATAIADIATAVMATTAVRAVVIAVRIATTVGAAMNLRVRRVLLVLIFTLPLAVSAASTAVSVTSITSVIVFTPSPPLLRKHLLGLPLLGELRR
jgi:hypothetical protein